MAGDDTSADLEVVGQVLDADLFESLEEVRAVSERWLLTYNHERPHDSLGAVPYAVMPWIFRRRDVRARGAARHSTILRACGPRGADEHPGLDRAPHEAE